MAAPGPSIDPSGTVNASSLSPASQDTLIQPLSRSPSPDDLQEDEIQKIRERVLQMGPVATPEGGDNTNANAREKELADMILRLTNRIRPDTSQLTYQADLIATLTEQRNYLLAQAEEQRERWQCERYGWERTAEALTIKRTTDLRENGNEDALERQVLNVETDNRVLREQLTESQARLLILESELARLRPLLLMQPYYDTHSHPRSALNMKGKRKGKKIIEEGDSSTKTALEEPDQSMNLYTPTPPSKAPEDDRPKSPSHSHYRHFQLPFLGQSTSNTNRTKLKSKSLPCLHPRIPLLTDARMEHLLLAARKIGRKRAGIVAGIIEKERLKTDKERKPKRELQKRKPPQGGMAQHMFVFMPQQAQRPPADDISQPTTPALPTHYRWSLNSPVTPSPPNQTSRGREQPNRLESLVSAARSMMNEDGVAGNSGTEGSPVPKRRKVSTVSSDGEVQTQTRVRGPLSRTRSALDVLADHAAGLSPTSHSRSLQAADISEGNHAVTDNIVTEDDADFPAGAKITPTKLAREGTTAGGRPDVNGLGNGNFVAPNTKETEDEQLAFEFAPWSPRSNLRPVSVWEPSDEDGPTDGDWSQKPQRVRTEEGHGIQGESKDDEEHEHARYGDSPIPPTPPSPTLQPTALSNLATPIMLSRANSNGLETDSERCMEASDEFEDGVDRHEETDADARPSAVERVIGWDVVGSDIDNEAVMVPNTRDTYTWINAETDLSAQRLTSPHVDCSEEEDLQTQAVSKPDQKWHQVQKALPTKSYPGLKQHWYRGFP